MGVDSLGKDGFTAPPAVGLRRAVLAWRDFWIEETSLVLDREAKALWVELEDIQNAQNLLDTLLRNKAIERSEQHIVAWADTLQCRLPDAAFGDLVAVIKPELPADVAETLVERLRSEAVIVRTLAQTTKLKKASKTSGTRLRREIQGIMLDETGSLMTEIEAYLHRLCLIVLAQGRG